MPQLKFWGSLEKPAGLSIFTTNGMVFENMNIFVLDQDIEKCAHYHCDQHVVKMILESAQMLCTTLNKRGVRTPYKPTHANHPCVVWLDQSYDNFLWLKSLALALNAEYRFRYERDTDHASVRVIRELENHTYSAKGLTPFVQVMPDKYKTDTNTILAYRAFYIGEKLSFARWTKRPMPSWIHSGSA